MIQPGGGQTKKITRKTKIQQGKDVLITTFPAIIAELEEIKKGDTIEWEYADGVTIIKKSTE